MRALAPHWGALLALALFLAAGLAVLDDYGVVKDEVANRTIAATIWDFLGGDNGALTSAPFYVRVYGPSFELALLLAERAFGLQDSRSVHLSNHLIIHASFLAGGLFAYLLAHRLSGDGRIALFAMAIFLLHPRIYAHSFLNSKDIAFLAMFMIALFLAHRAFRRDTLLAFALLGAAVGVLVNLRIMGVVLLAAIPALLALDFAFAQGWAERKRILLSTGAFALSSGLVFFALLPYLWADPLARTAELWATLSDHPFKTLELFRGTLHPSAEFPSDYVPVYFSITSPPFALLLGLIGAAAVLGGAVRTPRVAMRRGRLRFCLLLVGCVAATAAAVILLEANVYNGWRHMYFLWAPFALLAALGLWALLSALRRARPQAAVYGAVGVGVAATLISAALIHPNQQAYFNFFVDRVAPERLRMQYEMDYWGLAMRHSIEWLLQSDSVPSDGVQFNQPLRLALRILPEDEREKLSDDAGLDAFVLKRRFELGVPEQTDELVLRRVQVYNNTIVSIERKGGLREFFESTAGRDPLVESVFDLHLLDNGEAAVVKQPCAPSFIGETLLYLQITPVDPNDLPPWGRREGFERIRLYGAAFDGKCAAHAPLPNYPAAEIRATWSPDLVSDAEAQETMRRAREEGRLLARAEQTDVYLARNVLAYIQDSCDPMDTERAFYADVVPERIADLPEGRRTSGYERFRFDFLRYGAFVGEACVTAFALPDYPVAAVRTGQLAPDGGNAWRAEFSLNPEPYRSAYLSAAQGEPLARGVFDVYPAEGGLVYAKESCDWSDTEARFFLHVIPERVEDLPKRRREHGFDNLDFSFFGRGGYFDGKCAARVPLPEYPIASVRTGQFGSAVEIWSAEFAVEGGRFPLTRG